MTFLEMESNHWYAVYRERKANHEGESMSHVYRFVEYVARFRQQASLEFRAFFKPDTGRDQPPLELSGSLSS